MRTRAILRYILRLRGSGIVRLSHLWYSFLRRFPLPAGDKWHLSRELMQVQINGLLDVARNQVGNGQGEALVARTLHNAGRQWVERQYLPSVSPRMYSGQVADTMSVALRALDMPSKVGASRGMVKVTTFRCPFLEEAKRAGEPAPVVCERTCGQIKSLFKGFSEGFPAYLLYRAPQMMGRGATACTKELELASGQFMGEAQG